MIETDRWPPVYDADDLKEVIRELSSSTDISKRFYSSPEQDKPYQGDILELPSPIPVLWSDGNPAAQSPPPFWLVLGNTCDIDREISDVAFTQIAPVVEVDNSEITPKTREDFLSYAYSRRFYLPPWSRELEKQVFFADFTKSVSIHKEAIFSLATITASLNFNSWLLLHSCLVRFLARDDGRYD